MVCRFALLWILLNNFISHLGWNFLPTQGLLCGLTSLEGRGQESTAPLSLFLSREMNLRSSPLLCEWTSDRYLLECCVLKLSCLWFISLGSDKQGAEKFFIFLSFSLCSSLSPSLPLFSPSLRLVSDAKKWSLSLCSYTQKRGMQFWCAYLMMADQ